MNYNKKSIEDVDVSGKRVLCRCDFNVPTKDGKITSDKRIVAALPTIQYLMNHGAKVILCSHMGKPKGEWKPELSLRVVAQRLSELLGKEVLMAADVVGEDARAKAAALQNGDVMLLENVRYSKGETKNDPELSKELASLADLFVNDAFGTAHRAHSSTAGVADYLPAVCGYLVQKEVGIMGKALADPERPFVAILGGAKVSDKLAIGCMCLSCRKPKGCSHRKTGWSWCGRDVRRIPTCRCTPPWDISFPTQPFPPISSRIRTGEGRSAVSWTWRSLPAALHRPWVFGSGLWAQSRWTL